MVVNSEVENKTPFRTLPPATTHENDVIASRMAIIQKNLQKKLEPPRFAGGIWDVDDRMDTAESADVANRESLHRQLKTMLQEENPYFEIDDRMDTIETSNSENLSFLSPEVPKKEPETMKKKSMEEVSLERSKRCRTSSKTEVYTLQSFNVESEFSQAVMSKESRPVEGTNAEPIVSEVENTLLHQILDSNSPATNKESQIDINDDTMQADGIGLKTEAQNFYQKEIENLQKVVLILKSHNTDEKEHSQEVVQLQKICQVLENLGNINKSVPEGDLAGEAAFTLNRIRHNEYQSPELTNPIQDNLQPVVNEDEIQDPCGSASHSVDSKKKSETGSENQWLQQIVDGTLPWKPTGRPPPATAFGIGPNAINSSKMQLSMSSRNGALPQTEEKSSPEQSSGRAMETDDIFEILKNAGSRGSPPPIAAFGKSPTSSPSRTISKPSSMTQEDLVALFDEVSRNGLPMSAAAVEAAKVSSKEKIKEKGQQDEQVGEAPKVRPLEMDVNSPKHASASTSRSVLELNSVNSVPSFKAKTAQSPYHLRSSTKIPDLYQSKEPKSPEGKNPMKDNVTIMKEAVPPSPLKYIPPHLRSKSSSSSGNEASRNRQGSQGFRPESKTPQNRLRSRSKTRDASFPYKAQEQKATVIKYPVKSNVTMKTDISNQQAQGCKTETWSNWRKEDSPPKLNDLSSSFKQGAVEDSYTKLPPNDGKALNLNLKTDSSSYRSNPSVYSDSSKRNRPAKANDRKILNNDLRKEKSAYGVQHSDENAMISLKVFDEKNALVDERTLPLSQLAQIIKNFPSLSDVIPSPGEKDRELLMSGNAVKVFLGCVFSASAIRIPGWEVALEAYYLAKKYGVAKLQDHCKDYFNFRDIHLSQVESIVQIARKFEITDALKNSTMFAEVPVHNIPDPTQPVTIKEQKCTISCTLYVDPVEFPVPLYYVKETGLGSTIEADIHNDITFEAKSGTFCLTGLQIKLEAETKDFRKEVSILCDVYKNNKKVFDLKREKQLNTLMIIDFKQRLLVEPGQSVSISVLMEEACMRMCHCLAKEKEFGRCEGGGRFEVSFESDRKSEAKRPLFFVEKLLYTFEGWIN
ncbi:hypothetical protein JTE90_016214 [Oedothorax gibbosus]|uniref:Uncharacterized protein n=1 Tax=Oedothorax gibbosus TaxID=931172 RepID=A0AAV6UMG2_9ARAC|nr:hypothetical protein JTE90_016214 [Oedothorax gibbosus]